VPSLVLWLRYSGFLVLYPTGAPLRRRACAPCRADWRSFAAHTPGVASELSLIYMALPYLRDRKTYSIAMPNALNFAFDSTDLWRLVSVSYAFGLPMVRWQRCVRAARRSAALTGDAPAPQLYGYMLQQRKRQLRPAAKAKSA
jgi:hypothetical protein